MDSTLVQFLEQLGTLGDGTRRLVLCRPGPMARTLIHLTGLDTVATVETDLPSDWPEIPAPSPSLG
jgi:anti-anti-sigma regulatory factor